MPALATARRKPARHASSLISFVAEFHTGTVIDRASATVRGVRLCGPRSKNGRVYPVHVLERAVKLYEGRPVHVGHHTDPHTGMPLEVSPTAKFGRVVNVRVQSGGLHGDLKYIATHPFAETFLWAVEHDPRQFSFSHLARVKWATARDPQGNLVAEEIEEVASIDIVSEGGTNETVFESKQPNSGATSMNDPKAFVSQFDGIGALVGFLVDMMKEVREQFEADALAQVKTIMGIALNAAPTSTPAPAMSSSTPDELAAVMAEARQRRALVDSWTGPGTGKPGGPDIKALAAACPTFW